MDKNLSISEVNAYVKRLVENDVYLMNMNVEGEISNIKYHPTGHIYFTLKDDKSRINAVMFASYASKLNEVFKDGDKVVVKCKIGVYESAGSYQLYVSSMTKAGIGDLYIEFEKLKKRLEEEGIFSSIYKKPIPKYPSKIAIISASTGAAIQDIRNTYNRRWPIAEVTLYPSLVQGAEASKDIVKNITLASKGDYDVIILARGGGSIEDLWCFNEEEVARAIIACPIPIVSGVGHEIDFTIADFASSLRAPTPTGAMEMVTPSIDDVLLNIANLDKRLMNALGKLLENKNVYLNALIEKFKLTSSGYTSKISSDIDLKVLRLKNAYEALLRNKENKYLSLVDKLDAISPLKVLGRGYSIVSNEEGKAISDIKDINVDESLNIRFNKGKAKVKVINKESE